MRSRENFSTRALAFYVFNNIRDRRETLNKPERVAVPSLETAVTTVVPR